MKIVKAKIEGWYLIPPSNEPYKKRRLYISSITHYYENGEFEQELNSMFGFEAEDGFYQILDLDCEIELIITNRVHKDNYYTNNDFKNACYHKTLDNPYHLPNWTKLK